MIKSQIDHIIYRTSLSMSSAYAGRDFGILWAKYSRYHTLDEVLHAALSLHPVKRLIRPDYILGFVLGFDPTFVNMLTIGHLLEMGYDPSVLPQKELLEWHNQVSIKSQS